MCRSELTPGPHSQVQRAPTTGTTAAPTRVVIPKRGEKDFEPLNETVTIQEKMLRESRQALFDGLSGVRGTSRCVRVPPAPMCECCLTPCVQQKYIPRDALHQESLPASTDRPRKPLSHPRPHHSPTVRPDATETGGGGALDDGTTPRGSALPPRTGHVADMVSSLGVRSKPGAGRGPRVE